MPRLKFGVVRWKCPPTKPFALYISLVSMPGADNVYMAKLAEQAERYEEMVRAHRRRRTAPLSPPPHGPHPPPQLTPPTVCVRRLST